MEKKKDMEIYLVIEEIKNSLPLRTLTKTSPARLSTQVTSLLKYQRFTLQYRSDCPGVQDIVFQYSKTLGWKETSGMRK